MDDLSHLTYPKKSHRKEVSLPEESVELAEFFGIMMGDGGIGNPWQTVITLNSVADAEYAKFVVRLIQKLFAIEPTVRKRKNQRAFTIVSNSTSLVDFLARIGLPRGDKLKARLMIPHWILSNQGYRRAVVRGLMDTDGCLYVHKHRVAGNQYKNIGLCFCSYSPPVIQKVAEIFEEFGIIPHISNHGRSIYLYKADAVARYLDVFGTSNERISTVYKNWIGGVG